MSRKITNDQGYISKNILNYYLYPSGATGSSGGTGGIVGLYSALNADDYNFYVSTSHPNNNAGTDPNGKTFDTIQGAIDAIAALSPSVSDTYTITVCSNTYIESPSIDLPCNLVIKGSFEVNGQIFFLNNSGASLSIVSDSMSYFGSGPIVIGQLSNNQSSTSPAANRINLEGVQLVTGFTNNATAAVNLTIKNSNVATISGSLINIDIADNARFSTCTFNSYNYINNSVFSGNLFITANSATTTRQFTNCSFSGAITIDGTNSGIYLYVDGNTDYNITDSGSIVSTVTKVVKDTNNVNGLYSALNADDFNYYVSVSHPNNNINGDPNGKTFASIQGAIDAIAGDSPTIADTYTITVCNNVYLESPTIDLPCNLVIKGNFQINGEIFYFNNNGASLSIISDSSTFIGTGYIIINQISNNQSLTSPAANKINLEGVQLVTGLVNNATAQLNFSAQDSSVGTISGSLINMNLANNTVFDTCTFNNYTYVNNCVFTGNMFITANSVYTTRQFTNCTFSGGISISGTNSSIYFYVDGNTDYNITDSGSSVTTITKVVRDSGGSSNMISYDSSTNLNLVTPNLKYENIGAQLFYNSSGLLTRVIQSQTFDVPNPSSITHNIFSDTSLIYPAGEGIPMTHQFDARLIMTNGSLSNAWEFVWVVQQTAIDTIQTQDSELQWKARNTGWVQNAPNNLYLSGKYANFQLDGGNMQNGTIVLSCFGVDTDMKALLQVEKNTLRYQ